MWETFFGFKKAPFSDCPDARQLFSSAAWLQVKTRFDFLIQHPGAGLLTVEVGAGKSVHFSSGTALDLLRQIALTLDLQPAPWCGSIKVRSSIPSSSAMRRTCCLTRLWSSCRCC